MNRIPDFAGLKRLEKKPHTLLDPWVWKINPNELPFRWWLYWVAKEYEIKTSLELGVNLGRTTCMLAAGVQECSIGVDIKMNWPGIIEAIDTLPREFLDRLAFVEGDSASPETAERVATLLNGRPLELLFIDSWHTVEHVTAELAMYGPMLAPVSLVVMDDLKQPPELYDLFYSLPGTPVELDWLHPLLGNHNGPSCGFAAMILNRGMISWL